MKQSLPQLLHANVQHPLRLNAKILPYSLWTPIPIIRHGQGVRQAVEVGDLSGAATYVRSFREIDAGALADSSEMFDMDEAVKK